MDRGTSAADLFSGKVFPLKLGMIGIINRGQLDINQGKTIKDALESEQAFFDVHYPALKQRCGTAFLAKTLNKLLLPHIRTALPDLRVRIRELQVRRRWPLCRGCPQDPPAPAGGLVDGDAADAARVRRPVDAVRRQGWLHAAGPQRLRQHLLRRHRRYTNSARTCLLVLRGLDSHAFLTTTFAGGNQAAPHACPPTPSSVAAP